MADADKVSTTAKRLVEATRDSYLAVMDHTVSLQERNVRFAQSLVDTSIKELRSQAENNSALTQELLERADKQRDAFQTLLGESVDAYVDFLYAPLSYYRQGLSLVENEVAGKTTR